MKQLANVANSEVSMHGQVLLRQSSSIKDNSRKYTEVAFFVAFFSQAQAMKGLQSRQ